MVKTDKIHSISIFPNLSFACTQEKHRIIMWKRFGNGLTHTIFLTTTFTSKILAKCKTDFFWTSLEDC